ncbi:hypothetical protein PPL_10402 [Heterostelium album PN500]|uniref:very-long-chain (3R)-3-hydroxyacyl-CoA dehydratase n=1 Tax=Heterostelium pallidum (strain ATCC 26659 / Pp 5 / PN500) TaxID=670386 RepID=D3BQZ9_HETP5|nr:hypothetical protein PPL_10402 [Heterostelium album PN500]EFA76185.1 hypothetical protein PPL_10402 [Heterostelium album PN500]|eukprot:XP_020428318.1 hypothetical protein PPL_10402 [Heterostelium album PN500]
MFQALGWYYVIISMFMRLFFQGTQSIYTTFNSLGSIVCTLQVFAFLEIAHVYFGIVKSSLLPTVVQVLFRNQVLLGCLLYVPEAQVHWGVTLLFFFWGVSELIRFPFYIAQAYGDCPPILTWLRYNAFIILYPIGFAAENILYYVMMPYILVRRVHFWDMPNYLNFSFNYYYFLLIWIGISLLGFPKQYLYMFTLRKKKMLESNNESSSNSKKIQ